MNAFLWGGPMLALLFGTHIYLTFHLKFIQKKIKTAIRSSFHSSSDEAGNAGTFTTLATTLAATLGTGNIVGVSTAIALGGPGALLWCWLTGLFGMATTYSECFIGFLYRRKMPDGTYRGGTMYALEHGLGMKKTAVFFAISTILASYGMVCTTQSRSVADAAAAFGFPNWCTGVLIAALVGLVVLGGSKNVQDFCTHLVPAMALIYMLGCTVILVMNKDYLGSAVILIFKSAFSLKAVSGGLIGGGLHKALRYGIARGLFTNEAGIGSASIAAASSSSKNPKEQSLVSMSATFWDTVVMCAITGLIIVSTLIKQPDAVNGLSYSEWTGAAFSQIPYVGNALLQISLIAFGTATLIGWSFFGEKAVEYLGRKSLIVPYRIGYVFMILAGSILSLDFVWESSDFLNICMMVPNLVMLYGLREKIKT